jgi:hypothetical protein
VALVGERLDAPRVLHEAEHDDGAEVFGAAFAGSGAIATLLELGGTVARILDGILLLIGLAIMVQFVRNAHRIEPFTR